MVNFAPHHAIITGGSSGIGKAIAALLVQGGSNVSLIARDPTKLIVAQQELQLQCLHPGQRVEIWPGDVSDRDQITALIEAAIATFDGVDLLITSAGMAYPGHFQQLPLAIHEQSMAVNYFGSLYAVKAVVPTLEQQGRGQIGLISSGAGLIGLYGYTPYSPTKFALRGLAESLRPELKPLGIDVSIIYPPDTNTPQLAQENQTKPAATKAITATAEMWEPEALAQVVLKGLARKQFIITPGVEMTLLGRFHSVLSPVLNWYFDRLVKKSALPK